MLPGPTPETALSSIRQVSGWLWDRGWAEWSSGNLSVEFSPGSANLFQTKSYILETPYGFRNIEKTYLISLAGSKMRDLMQRPEEGLCVVQPIEKGKLKVSSLKHSDRSVAPTSEYISHLLIQELMQTHRPQHRAVLHSHPAEVIAFSQLPAFHSHDINQVLEVTLPEFRQYFPEGIGKVPYHPPGSLMLAEATANTMKNCSVAIWQQHGIIATGTTLYEAFDAIDVVVKAIRIYFLLNHKH